MSVFATLQQRGFIAQTTDAEAVAAYLDGLPGAVYTGYDPTADSLHVGHLLTLMALMHLQRAGHQVVVLVGDATAQVGDPSGRSALRPMLSASQIGANADCLEAQLRRFFGAEADVVAVRNGDWLKKVGYLDFLSDIGRHFSVNRMLAAETYKQRLVHGLSFIEFNYQILQAYDFLQLRRSHRVGLQLGGDDQWSNILAGVELNRRVDGALVQGLTLPLLTTATGEKMGKTQGGAVWLDPERLSPGGYFHYFYNVDDADVGRFLRLFTLLPLEEIAAAENLPGAQRRAAKTVLAFESCQIVHGTAAAVAALAAERQAFGHQDLPAALLPSSQLPRQAMAQVEVPTHWLTAAQLQQGLGLTQLLVDLALCPSKGAARRLIEQGAVRRDMQPLRDPLAVVDASWFAAGPAWLWAGKKRARKVGLQGT